MTLSAGEKATLNFYRWEYLGRGYYHFDEQVAIEPPFTPFVRRSFSDSHYIDDGRSPTVFESIANLFTSKTVKKEEEFALENTIVPNIRIVDTRLVGFSFAFQKDQEISSLISEELLSMLAFTDDCISFEIIGTHKTITFQIVCSPKDKTRVKSHLKGYFPSIIISDIDVYNLGFYNEKTIAIADFGFHDEFMRPISTNSSFSIDPLTSIIATLDNLQYGETTLVQIMFKGATAPWANSILQSVTDGSGENFFSNAPEMLTCAEEKVSKPLFSCVLRIATQGNTNTKSQYLATELSRSITSISTSKYNKLIPLSNEGYSYENHLKNLYERSSNRLGMLLNTNELTTFIHYPNKTVVSSKLGLPDAKSKKLPISAINQKYILGINKHNGEEHEVSIDDKSRLRHTHIIGATGVGKSTLIANMMLEDMNAGNGCVLFDPHGDIVEDILLRIPEYRKDDVILIDPSDTEFPIGFNLLEANTEAEKIVLSSDLVSAFKRHATAWGDNMTAVLSNAINTFLDSHKGGTLIELKRFLLEDSFRKTFLESVEDPSIHYYWEHEYYMVKKGITPLLTRIDTFLRPKIIRYMLVQNEGVNFKECIEKKKIILIKLSQGLIGQDNSYLLGSLFLSKLNQVLQSRQSIEKTKRHPYYLYLDEFQNFITPSIASILSGGRKYGLGLILAHQELAQIDDSKTLNSVISNPHIRICFRLGDNDAKRLEQGFSYFEQSDLQNLEIGKAIMRLGSSNKDCNISTYPLTEIDTTTANNIKNFIIQNTRETYTKSNVEINTLLKELLPKISRKKYKKSNENEVPPNINSKLEVNKVTTSDSQDNTEKNIEVKTKFEEDKNKYLKSVKESETIRKHRYLQNEVRSLAIQRGFKATIEQETENGGRVDIALIRDDICIAVEILVTNTLDYEVRNIQKCIDSRYTHVCMLSESLVHLKNIRKRASQTIDKIAIKKVSYLIPLEFPKYLDDFIVDKKTNTKRVRGYRVVTNYDIDSSQSNKQSSISKLLIEAVQKKK